MSRIYNTVANEKRKYEYDLTLEEFYYNSIRTRKKLSKLELIPLLSTLALLTPIVVILVGKIIQFLNKDMPGIEMAWLVFVPLALVILGGYWIITMIKLFKCINRFVGLVKNKENFGNSNYTSEQIESRKRIDELKKKIDECDKEIKQLKSNENKANNTRTIYEYAFGVFNEDEATVNLRIQNNYYENENETLVSEIKKEYDKINNLNRYVKSVNEEYDKVMNNFTYYIMATLLLIMVQLLFGNSIYVSIIVGVLGGILLIAFMVNYVKYSDVIIQYKVEHNYKKIEDYAEKQGLIPTKQKIEQSIKIIEEKNTRKDFIDKVLEYKNNIKSQL